MKYFMKIVHLESNVENCFSRYPVIFLATDEEINFINRIFLELKLHGVNPELIYLSPNKKLSSVFSLQTIITEISSLEEISPEIFDTLKKIEAWNPLTDFIETVENYLKFYDQILNSKKIHEKREEIHEFFKKSFEEMESLKINDTSD